MGINDGRDSIGALTEITHQSSAPAIHAGAFEDAACQKHGCQRCKPVTVALAVKMEINGYSVTSVSLLD